MSILAVRNVEVTEDKNWEATMARRIRVNRDLGAQIRLTIWIAGAAFSAAVFAALDGYLLRPENLDLTETLSARRLVIVDSTGTRRVILDGGFPDASSLIRFPQVNQAHSSDSGEVLPADDFQ